MSSNSLLIASVTDPGHWYLFDKKNSQVAHHTYSIQGKEFDTFLATLEKFLDANQLDITAIDTIYLVTWPASFTGWRIMTLTLGSLALVYPKLKLVGITLFEYWKLSGNAFPMAVEANREELVIQRGPDTEIEIVSKKDVESIHFKSWYYRTWNFAKWENLIQFNEEILTLPPDILRRTPGRILHPLYIKKPNITISPTSHDTSKTAN
jgi:tRNA A37 threonylcarbamoyladenosine modification protein TsaB